MYALVLALLLQISADSTVSRVTFHIRTSVPVKSDTVHVIGNHPVLGSWDHMHSLRLKRSTTGLWQGTVLLPHGIDVAFKITCGSWSSEAVSPDGTIPSDTWLHTSGDTTIAMNVDRWKDDIDSRSSTITGTLRHHEKFQSSVLGTSRDVWVILPDSYERDFQKRYPVLYAHDGQNVFDARLSFSGIEWGLDEAADSLAQAGIIPEVIIVAVANSPHRLYEYADTTMGELYARFMAQELKAFVDTTYRTMPDREYTAVMGSSMGGLISFLMVWWYPDVYGQAACLSPAFLWGDEKIFRTISAKPFPYPHPKIYLDVGDSGIERDLQPGTKRMAELLETNGWTIGNELFCGFITNADHDEKNWASRATQVLAYLFAPWEDIEELMKGAACE